MTVEATNAFSGPYAANGVTTTFPFDFKAMSDAEIVVTNDSNIVASSSYSVELDEEGGSVVFTIAPTSGTIYIASDPSFLQEVDFTNAGPFLPASATIANDRAAIRDIWLRDAVSRAVRAPLGEQLTIELPAAADRAGGFLAFDANGQPVASEGTGADSGLRSDLAALTGASLVMASSGETLEAVATRPKRLSFNATKTRAYDRPTAITMAQDTSYMKGFAKNAGTTGGAGKTVYWVTRSSDDPNTPGTLRYAVNAATAAGGGQIFFDPRRELDIVLASRLDLPANVTIAAPGRNVRIQTTSNLEMFHITTANIIIKFIEFSHLIDPTGINNKLNPGDPGYDAQQGGPANQADAISVIPTTADKIWIDQCTFQHISDGMADVATSTLHVGGGNCRFSVSRCLYRDQYKVMLCGSTSVDPADVLYTAARSVFGSYYENWYDHTAERHPRVSALGYADSVNNIFDLSSIQADDGVASGSYGIGSYYGAWVRTRGDLFRTLDGVATLAVDVSDGTGGVPESAAINESSVAEGALTIGTRNVATPTALPAVNYDLVPTAVPAGPLREAYRNTICAAAGARVEAMPSGLWQYNSTDTTALNGVTVRAAPDKGLVGRYLLVENQQDIVPTPEALSGASTAPTWVRGSTKTIAADVLTIDQTAAEFAINPESGNADNIVTINGGVENQVLVLRPGSDAYTLTVLATGNVSLGSYGKQIVLTGSRDQLTLRYEAARGWMVIAAPPQAGTYTPTITGITNVASTGAANGRWLRNGNIVTVTGNMSITPTAAALADTLVTISLPVASNLAVSTDLDGTGGADDAVNQTPGTIKGAAATDTAQYRFKAATTSARTHSFVFQYTVI